GLWAWLLAGAWILFGIAYAARRLARTQAPPSAEAVPHAHPHADSRYNVLVVAGESSAPDAIRRSVVSSAAGRETSAYVVAPAFSSSLDRLTGDEGAYERASRRLQATLAALEPVSASRDGKVGSHDPVQAVDEGLREFPSDEILLAHHPKGGPSRQTMDVADICRER